MEEQSGREFASADPTTGAQDATFQERSLRAEIPLNPRRRLQHLQRPTPSHISPIAPRAARRGNDHVARGRRGPLEVPHSNPASRRRFDNVTTSRSRHNNADTPKDDLTPT
jgi:hypothetical protein